MFEESFCLKRFPSKMFEQKYSFKTKMSEQKSWFKAYVGITIKHRNPWFPGQTVLKKVRQLSES
jgi:hypothetical protein